MIYFGTSGFSYEDWAGKFYPQGMPKREWLVYYSHEFNVCEINSTFYALPGAATIKSMAAKGGEGFHFVFKANQEMTHQRGDNGSVFKAFCELMSPLRDAGRLGCVLAQFPYSFRCNGENLAYLEAVVERLPRLPLVVEFRNAQWLKPEVFQWLRQRNVGFCCVDEPQLPNLIPPIAEASSNIAYVRFHGRNKEKWWNHKHAYERYDYSYSEEELEEWVPRIRHLAQQAENTFVFANNHWQGQAVSTIRQIKMLLE